MEKRGIKGLSGVLRGGKTSKKFKKKKCAGRGRKGVQGRVSKKGRCDSSKGGSQEKKNRGLEGPVTQG